MVTPDHLCPWGIKGYLLLKRHNFEIEDVHLSSSEENKKYKEENNLSETPDFYIDGQHLGGYDALREHLGMSEEATGGKSYRPVVVIFAISGLLGAAYCFAAQTVSILSFLESFVCVLMILLGLQKLQTPVSFTNGFLQYDLLGQKSLRYAHLYPYIETGAGLFMLIGWMSFITAPITLFISIVGAGSVIKAVYINKRTLECACTGGGDGVPLGALSLTENLLMILLSVWMIIEFILK